MEPAGTNSGSSGATKDHAPAKDLKRKNENKDEDLSEEDLELKQQLELYVERVQDADPELQKVALESMRDKIRAATSSMISVPKPLKFLRPHYATLKAHYEKMADTDMKKQLADIISVLAVTMSPEGKRESLKYKLLGSDDDIGSWGHAYVRNLAGEVSDFIKCQMELMEETSNHLRALVEKIVAFHMKHNTETEAVDLILEVGTVEMLLDQVGSENYKRTCLYITNLAKILPRSILSIARSIYMKFEEYPRALQLALCPYDMECVDEIFKKCQDPLKRRQLCFILARHGYTHKLSDLIIPDNKERKALQNLIYNKKLNEGYLTLARDIEVMEPKSPDDIYNEHLVDSARQNLAATFVNAFVNAGFGQDKLVTGEAGASSCTSLPSWLFKHNEHGRTSAVASLGMILLWDIDSGLAQLFTYHDSGDHHGDTHVIAGALIGIGIANCKVWHERNPAYSLLSVNTSNENASIKIGAIVGLGLRYAGSEDDRDVFQLLCGGSSLDVIAFAAISLGLIYLGTCNKHVAEEIVCALMDRSESELAHPLARFLPLAIGLVFLGKEKSVEAQIFNQKIRKHCDVTLLSCAYAGTGNVLKVQELLRQCAEHDEKGESFQGPAVLGIAMVAMAEEVGLQMAIRSLEHLLKYGGRNIRKAVPLALALLHISNPKTNVMDTLSKLSHDADSEVAMTAIISLGLIGAGTNNARIAGMLRNLSSYYYRNDSLLFCVRIAQGLVHLGKGLLTLSPFHSEGSLLSPPALAGLVIVLHACLDMRTLVLGEYHYILYFLALAIHPKMLMTVDENLNPLPVPVRVGQAVDDAVAGRPKKITGSRTLTTPVILNVGEKAELATDKYIPLSPYLEGFVILQENPDYMEEN